MANTEVRKRSKGATEKKDKSVKKSSVTAATVDKKDAEESAASAMQAKFGPLPGITKHRLWSRSALIIGLMVIVYFSSGKKEEIFADSKSIRGKSMETKCSPAIEKSTCGGKKCGRLVTDVLFTGEEAFALVDICRRGFVSHPGISVIDLAQKVLKMEGLTRPLQGVFQKSDSIVFKTLKGKLQQLIASHFGIDIAKLRLANPAFLSMFRPGGKDTVMPNTHQKAFSYTYSAMVFLTQHDRDVEGGKLVFVDSDNVNRTVLPVQGRTVIFSSGDENTFFVDKVTKGLSYFLTIGFTCDKGMADPTF